MARLCGNQIVYETGDYVRLINYCPDSSSRFIGYLPIERVGSDSCGSPVYIIEVNGTEHVYYEHRLELHNHIKHYKLILRYMRDDGSGSF
jgi:hypothetical protein